MLPLERDQLSALIDLDAPLSGLGPPFADRWPDLSRIPWVAAVGDGACSNVGSGCCAPERLALMVGTSGAMRVMGKTGRPPVPRGLWCYRANRSRFVMGGSLSNGGLLFEWMTGTLRLERDPESVERGLAEMPPDSHGLTLLPFLAGERSPGWQSKARAAVTGLSLHTRPIEILRASLESVAYRFAKIARLLEPVVPEDREIVASGGALLQSPVWMQIMADVLGQAGGGFGGEGGLQPGRSPAGPGSPGFSRRHRRGGDPSGGTLPSLPGTAPTLPQGSGASTTGLYRLLLP